MGRLPKGRRAEAKHRVQIDFKPPMVARIDRVVDRLDAASRAEVVRRALRLLKSLLDQQDKGGEVVVVHPDGTETKFMDI